MKRNQHIENYINRLQSLDEKEDRAALAALRRALSGNPRHITDTFRYVRWYLPDHPKAQDDYVLVGALFAYHSMSTEKGNMGDHFAVLRQQDPRREKALERRFSAVLKAHPDDLTSHLRAMVSLLKSQEIPINWYRFLYDVRYWGHTDVFVQRQWADAFWGRTGNEE